MTAKHFLLLLLTCCLGTSGLAQSDSLQFQQARLRIWCETARFAYADNGADSLLPTLDCNSWSAFKASIQQTDANLGVARLLESVDKEAIYQGITTTEGKLNKLVSEIAIKLKTSPTRRSDAGRLAGVDSLHKRLQQVAFQVSAATEPLADVPLASEEVEEDNLAEVEEVEAEEEEWFSINELLQWLALIGVAAYGFMRLRELEHDYKKLRSGQKTLENQVINLVTPVPEPPVKIKGLSEEEVKRLIQGELQKQKPAKSAVPPKPASHQPKQEGPGPATESIPVAPSPAKSSSGAGGIFYDKLPFKGGFHQSQLSPERQRDSLYTIKILPNQPNEAEYWVTEDPEVQRYAMQNGLSFFEEACQFEEIKENPSHVRNERSGKLRKEGPLWKIVEKVKVRFE